MVVVEMVEVVVVEVVVVSVSSSRRMVRCYLGE